MSKKANLTTLRVKAKRYLIFYEISSKKVASNYLLFKHFLHLLQSKTCWVFFASYGRNANVLKITLHLLISLKKIKRFKKQKKHLTLEAKKHFTLARQKRIISQRHALLNFLTKHFFSSDYIFKIRLLNALVNKKLMKKLLPAFKKYSRTLFSRKYLFLIDAAKATVMFLTIKNIHSSNIMHIFSSIFRHLQKKLHKIFFRFAKSLLVLLVRLGAKKKYGAIGCKFRINGRLKGKMRASTHVITYGKTPNQTIENTIEYSLSHVHTRYGVFGLHLWLLKKNAKIFDKRSKKKIQKKPQRKISKQTNKANLLRTKAQNKSEGLKGNGRRLNNNEAVKNVSRFPAKVHKKKGQNKDFSLPTSAKKQKIHRSKNGQRER